MKVLESKKMKNNLKPSLLERLSIMNQNPLRLRMSAEQLMNKCFTSLTEDLVLIMFVF